MATKTADFTSTCNHTDGHQLWKKLCMSADISLSSLVICLTFFFFANFTNILPQQPK